MNDTLTGIVLNTIEYKDNDLIVNCYCKDYGLVSFYGKGLQKMTSKNAYACQLFDKSEFTTDYNSFKAHQILKTAVLKDEHQNLKMDLDKMALASVVCEICSLIESEDLYDILELTLDKLAAEKEPYTVFNLFVVYILDLLGIKPEVDECVVCGDTKTIETISIEDGGFVCKGCNSQTHYKVYGANFLRKFRIANKASFEVYDKVFDLGLNEYELSELLMNFLLTHSGLSLKSMRSLTNLHSLG